MTGVGELSIRVPAGRQHYFAKLVNQGPGAFTIGVAIAPGRTASIEVPVCDWESGIYDLTYAAGDVWYGYGYVFGPEGAYAQATESFPFEDGTSWEVELILQPGGNLGTEGLDYESF